MNNSPIANRTRARVNIVHLDASNQDRMSERDLNRTPDSNGPVADQENGSIGRPGHSPNEFEGFEPNDIENVNVSNLYRAFMENSRNLGKCFTRKNTKVLQVLAVALGMCLTRMVPRVCQMLVKTLNICLVRIPPKLFQMLTIIWASASCTAKLSQF